MNNNEQSFYSNMPTLQAKEMELENNVTRIQNEIEEIKSHPRFESNPSEREYQIGLLKEELETTLQNADEDYYVELEAIEQHLSIQLFDAPKVDTETAQQANELVDNITTQVTLSSNPADTLAMLAVRAKTMNDAELHALQRQMPTITQQIQSKASAHNKSDIDKHLEAISNAASNTEHQRNINEQLDALKRVKNGGGSPADRYRRQDIARNIARQGISGTGGVSRGFYEDVIKGGSK